MHFLQATPEHLSVSLSVSEVRRGALPVSNMLLPFWEALQSVPAAEGPQLFLATGSLPISQMLCGIEQVSTQTRTRTNQAPCLETVGAV